MENRVALKAFLRNADGKYLFLKRSAHGSRPDEWDLPGGTMDPGETLDEALLREIEEETGINEVKTPKLVYAQSSVRNDEAVKYNYVLLLFIGDIDQTDVTLSGEHQEYMWTPLKESVNLVQHPLHKESIQRIIDNDLE